MGSFTQASPQTRSNSHLSKWPALPILDDSQFTYTDIEEKWLQHPCPVELGRLPIEVPAVVARFVKESARKEAYLNSECEDSICDYTRNGAALSAGITSKRFEKNGVDGKGLEESAEGVSNGERSKTGGKDGGMNFWKSFAKHIVAQKGDCVSCMESSALKRLVTLPCQHRYCAVCLNTMAALAIANEQSFPPQCCSLEIPSETIITVLTSKEKKRYTRKANEYATPPAERWYCQNPHCSKWIHPKYIQGKNSLKKCPKCKTWLCSTCRSGAHDYSDCSCNPDLERLLRKAQQRHWQRCYRCGAIVEVVKGCSHVICRCQAHFCYICGNPWKSRACTCNGVIEGRDDYLQLEAPRENGGPDLSAVMATIKDTGREESGGTDRRRQKEEKTRLGKEHRTLEIEKRITILSGFMSEVNKLQHACLVSRHKEDGIVLLSRQKAEVKRFHDERRELLGKLDRNLDLRIQKLITAQTTEIGQMELEQEEEENSLISRLPRLFKHQSNAEDRELSVLNKLRSIQNIEKARLVLEQQRVVKEAERKGTQERASLLSSIGIEWDTEQRVAKSALQSLVQDFVYDRYWFDQVVAKREDMLAKYRLELMNSRDQEE